MSQNNPPAMTELFPEKVRDELEKLTGSINTMMDNMRKMQNPILESREKLPRANEQLDKVSAQTEKATHKMLDMVEQIIEHQEKIVEISGEVNQFLKRSRAKSRDLYSNKLRRVNEMAETSQNNAFLIMDALQFQDITAQQMNHASSLLEDIEGRLQRLLGIFEGQELPENDESEVSSKSRAFDPNADMFQGRDQKEVDDIVSKAAHTES